jgi:beta-glucanase (GH16 family)
MRRWRLALSVALVLGLAIWGVGLQLSRVQPTGVGATTIKMPSYAKLVQKATSKGALKPVGPPEFSATFTGNTLDTSIWATCYPWSDKPTGCSNLGNDYEHQWYLPGQDRVSDGHLALVAQQLPTPGIDGSGQPVEYSCRSGLVTTYPGFQFEYGYIQVKAWIPEAPGLWPALWLAAANQKWPPEIDMLESWGDRFQSGVFFHPVGAPPVTELMAPPITQGWHTIALSWTASQITYYIDGTVMLTLRQGIPHQPMYFIANLAEYQAVTSPAYCKGQLLIQSVNVWRY